MFACAHVMHVCLHRRVCLEATDNVPQAKGKKGVSYGNCFKIQAGGCAASVFTLLASSAGHRTPVTACHNRFDIQSTAVLPSILTGEFFGHVT